ncbi:uncharacterized protein B0H64DRAFT_373205 [Chaetomium fimeti]|uniref:Aminoglycoside phosphotransferase domain-containing protein n=1 Tax=Chaetomium fimeti TaxID=1854472 RepID=A0AAE0HJX2_9PEZI|nr:hypothetical protein B0H64DRAFT_373205 [Chaetomium fimeti]
MSSNPSQVPETPAADDDDDETMRTVLDELSNMTPGDAIHGHVLYSYHSTPRPPRTHLTEADMMHYAATHGVLAPRVRGVYEVIVGEYSLARIMVSDRVPGVPLVDVWRDMTTADQAAVKAQLRVQLACMRACAEPAIGRAGGMPTRNVYDGPRGTAFGPFADEEAFDDWCLARVWRIPLVRSVWRRLLRGEREKRCGGGGGGGGDAGAGRFVLTHGDLTPRNIMVLGNVVTGIVDWELSGFFPEYAECAFARMCYAHEEWWIPVLEELLPACSKRRLAFTALVEDGMALAVL